MEQATAAPAPANGAPELVLPTAEEMVEKYLWLRSHIEAETKKFEASMQPYKNAQAALEAAAGLLMIRTKQRALSTNAGTAFRVTKTSTRCVDRDAWLDFVWQNGAWDGLTAHVSSDFVEQWMEAHDGQPPPGIKVESFVKVQFRKA